MRARVQGPKKERKSRQRPTDLRNEADPHQVIPREPVANSAGVDKGESTVHRQGPSPIGIPGTSVPRKTRIDTCMGPIACRSR